MGKDKDKLEKKRIKAEAKAHKKWLKAGKEPVLAEPETEVPYTQPPPTKTIVLTKQSEQKEKAEKVPWYKNPDWIRAIIAIASLIVAIIILMLNIYK